LTPDLLDVWTDPDTAMEVVGTSLGIFRGRDVSATKILATDASLRDTLFNVLLALVDGGALEKRPCGGGRDAFRWRRDINAKEAWTGGAVPEPPIQLAEAIPGPRLRPSGRPQPVVQAALLVVPALSCLLAVLLFVWLGHAAALAIAAALVVVGIAGLVRRVPFAGAWTIGIIAAGLLVRLS
jgi:hypothetical protein